MDDPNLELLGNDMMGLVGELRALPALGAELRSELWARIQTSVAALPSDGSGGSEPPTDTGQNESSVSSSGGKTLGRAGRNVALGWLSAGVVLGVGIGAGGYALLMQAPQSIDVRKSSTAEPPAEERGTALLATDPPSPAQPVIQGGSASSGNGNADTPNRESYPDAFVTSEANAPLPSRARERALLTQAQSALARRRSADALTALTQHRNDYPNGRFAEEREALWIDALRQAGQTEQARRHAAWFLARYPRSIFRDSAANALRE